MSNMFYFIDQNVIITILDILHSEEGKQRWAERKLLLDSINIEKNFISGMLCVMEGMIAKSETSYEKILTTQKISDALEKYFKHTDSKALVNFANELQKEDVEIGMHEWGFFNCLQYRDYVYSQLINRPKRELRKKFSKNFMKNAKLNNVSLSHPVVLCSISALYECEHSRDVLKVNKQKDKDNGYNAISDIYTLSRVPQLESMCRVKFNKFKFNFVTFDDGLKFIYETLITKPLSIDETNESHRVTYNATIKEENMEKLFPHTTQAEREAILSELGYHAPKSVV